MKNFEEATESEKLLSADSEDEPLLSAWKQRLLVFSYLANLFSALCADTFLFPFFPQKAKEKGLTDIQIGLVFSSFEFSRFVSSLITGYLAGKINSKTLCMTGCALTTAGCFAFGFTTFSVGGAFLPLCIASRMSAGTGAGVLAVSGLSILMKATSYKISTLASLAESAPAIGYIGGTAVGAALYELVGYTSVFWILGAVMVVMNIIQILTLPKLGMEAPSRRNAFHLLCIPGILLMFLSCFALKFESGARSTGISQYVTSMFHQSPSIIALMFSIWCAVYTVTLPIYNKILNKGFIFTSLVVAWPVTIIMVLLVGPSPLLDFIFQGKRYFLMTGGSVLFSILARAPLYTCPYQASVNLAEVNGHEKDSMQTYGMITGLVNGGFGLGAMVGPIIGGTITEMLDFPWSMTVVALVQTILYITLLTYLVYMKLTKQPLVPEEILDIKGDNSSDTDDYDE